VSNKTVRCTVCRAEFTDAELVGVGNCPACSSIGIPCPISDDVEISINWHELRILGMWSSNWAANHFPATDSAKALAMILHSIAMQHPEKAAELPLTLAGEIGNLRTAAESGELTGSPTTIKTNVRDILEEPEA
jgi:hypothetical protein